MLRLLFRNFRHQSGRGTGMDPDFRIAADRMALRIENAHLVLGRPPDKLPVRPFRYPFNQHVESFSEGFLIAFQRQPVLQFDNLVQPACLHFRRHIVRKMAGRFGIGPFRILEHESGIESYLFHQGKRVAVILLRLAAESGYYIGADGAVRQNFPYFGHPLQIGFPGIFPVHFKQHRVASRLDREMDMIADVRIHGHGVQHHRSRGRLLADRGRRVRQLVEAVHPALELPAA